MLPLWQLYYYHCLQLGCRIIEPLHLHHLFYSILCQSTTLTLRKHELPSACRGTKSMHHHWVVLRDESLTKHNSRYESRGRYERMIIHISQRMWWSDARKYCDRRWMSLFNDIYYHLALNRLCQLQRYAWTINHTRRFNKYQHPMHSINQVMQFSLRAQIFTRLQRTYIMMLSLNFSLGTSHSSIIILWLHAQVLVRITVMLALWIKADMCIDCLCGPLF